MNETISEVAQRLNLSAHTIRYYLKEGLLPLVRPNAQGIYYFDDEDIEWLLLLRCLKETGMSIRQIKQFVEWSMEGPSSIAARLQMFEQQRATVQSQIELWQQHLRLIEEKCASYQDALSNGTPPTGKMCLAWQQKASLENG